MKNQATCQNMQQEEDFCQFIATKGKKSSVVKKIKKVLLIENSVLYLKVLSELFSRLGYTPVAVSSKEEALEQLATSQFQMICLNLYFNGGNAIEFVREIRSYDPHVAVVMLTSTRDVELRHHAMQAGITEVIYKSNVQTLKQRLKRFTDRREEVDLPRRKVLYVEDSHTQAVVVSRILEEELNLEVEHHVSAETAMKRLQEENYDLIITDVLLKGEISGLCLLRYLRSLEDEKKANLPVLTITAHDDSARRLELLKAGTTDYIIKPVFKEELCIRVNNLIHNKVLLDRVLEQQKRLRRMAITDQLTGCYNRYGFKEFANKYIAHAIRREEPVSLLLLDLDLFKKINDRFGHDTGDFVLQQVGQSLREHCRTDDVIARYGGEEFVILLPNSSEVQAQQVADKINRQIRRLKPNGIPITVSIGISTLKPKNKEDIEVLLKQADRALYQAKRKGRNCYQPYCPFEDQDG